MSKVYFADARAKTWRYDYSVPAKLEEIVRRLGFSNYIEPEDYVAIKTHLGSPGAFRIVRPHFLRIVVDAVKAVGGRPFVTDTVRMKALDYLELANKNGINHSTLGAPIIIADGIRGHDAVSIKAGPTIGKVGIASAIHDADAMVVVTHVKGHIQAGFAGAIKNLAMGCACASHRTAGHKESRGRLHAADNRSLQWDEEKCIACGNCVDVCPTQSVRLVKGKIVRKPCWLCLRCLRVCPVGALTGALPQGEFQRALAEGARAALSTFKKNKVVFLSFMFESQPECDCMPVADVPMVQDQGILGSDDVVAIDQAAYDITLGADPLPQSLATDRGLKPGDDYYAELSPGTQPDLAFKQAARFRLGTRKYELVKIRKARKR